MAPVNTRTIAALIAMVAGVRWRSMARRLYTTFQPRISRTSQIDADFRIREKVAMHLVRLAIFALVLFALAPPACAAEPPSNETGPNFEAVVGTTLTAAAKADYDAALASFKSARTARSGQTAKVQAAIKDFEKAKKSGPKFAPTRYWL